MAHNSYTMCIRGLPDMYTLSPRAGRIYAGSTLKNLDAAEMLLLLTSIVGD